jgi:mannosylglycerate hydrolase
LGIVRGMAREVLYLVPHTHWDREWYEPFQRFRLRLVDLLDDVVPRAEADPTFRFTLDGQLAAVDDYLEVRPEAAGRVAALVHRRQLAIGPWAILLDEFLCSGENIVRNLSWGLARAAELGGAMPVGYLPDMFGHCAQMPQILAGAGLRQACVWRGVPAAITRHAFVWRAPDGTAIRTEYLPGGYGNAAGILADPAGLGGAAAGHLARMRPWYGTDPVLAMYGADHSAPLPGLTSAVAATDGAVQVRLSTLAEYLALFDPADTEGLPVWAGELRSHARANILPGVLSNRPHLKQALSHAERMVERYAEPLAALWAPAAAWPARLLDMAWQRLVQSSCHDSVTGCGVDDTALQVEARIAEAEQIGRGIRDRALAGLAAHAPADAVLVVNPSPWARTAVVRLDIAGPPGPDPVALRLPDGTTVATQTEEQRRMLYATVAAPPLGFTAVRAVPVAAPSPPVAAPVRVGERVLDSDLLRAEIAPDGTLTLQAADGTRVAGVGRIVDEGDVGDLYNFAPAPGGRTTDTPDEVTVHVLESGPLVGSVEVRRRYPWADVRTVVELYAGEPFCRLAIGFDNRHPDHRVRLHVPLARPATHSYAEGQFAVVARGLESEGGHGEVPLPTFPAYSFVDAGGVAVLLDQVSEYELVDAGRELAVTLLRATGLISRADHPLRAEPAGPVIETPRAQCLGPVRTRLAVLPHAGGWAEAGIPRASEAFRCPLVTVGGAGAPDTTLARRDGLGVEGDGVVLTSLRRSDADWLELRVVAMTRTPTAATIRGRFDAARRADLLGRPGTGLSTVDGQTVVPLRPWEIATIQLHTVP